MHDAPNEALVPGAASHFAHGELKRQSVNRAEQSPQSHFFTPQPFNLFNTPVASMPPPSIHERSTSFTQQSPPGTIFQINQPLTSPTATRQMSNMSVPTVAWHETLFGAEDPSLLNFDVSSMNFGNHYGALEFGMLDRMANGAGHTPDSETQTQRGSVGQYAMPFSGIGESPHFALSETGIIDWTQQPPLYNQIHRQASGPHAFAIESNQHFASPEARQHSPETLKHSESPFNEHPLANLPKHVQLPSQSTHHTPFLPLTTTSASTTMPAPTSISTPQLTSKAQPLTRKRPRDPSQIYTNVTTPHPYTTNFHHLITYLQTRFGRSAPATLAIAKSLASIRPSFIATTKTLNREDLIFMEKCFQRTLWEYEGFIEGVGTPTIVARRTGEIAAVGKEFQILTGWKKSVLLGREANLNVNVGNSDRRNLGSGRDTGAKGTGTNTPALQQQNTNAQQGDGTNVDAERGPRPVFLAELLDDDSVVEFYEDFARLAFGDSRGSVMSKGKLLKYRTREDEIAANLKREAAAQEAQEALGVSPSDVKDGIRPPNKRLDSFAGNLKKGISGEKGMQKLGENDGKVECAYCWTVKRDVFDIPMLIVMNVSPRFMNL